MSKLLYSAATYRDFIVATTSVIEHDRPDVSGILVDWEFGVNDVS